MIKISSKYKMRELYYRKIYTFLFYLFPLGYKKSASPHFKNTK